MGRRAGIPNKRTLTNMRNAERTGMTPLQYMLKVLRNPKATLERRDWAASAAAPYIHPRLASVQTNAHITGHLTLEALVSEAIKPVVEASALVAIEDKSEG